jgi:hypothetical protein
MSAADDAKQERDWQALHDRITETLNRFGKKDAFGKGDYWLVDDNWGPELHQLEFRNLSLLRPEVIKSLQALLADYPEWQITVCADVPAPRSIWPPRDITIYHDEIIDDLRREFLPVEFRSFIYEGAGPSKKVDPNDKSYIFRRAFKS